MRFMEEKAVSNNSAVSVKGLGVRLPGFELKDITMDIPKGVVVGLIGKNGAGKTTLIKALTDVYIPEAGTIMYDGISIHDNPVAVKEKLGIVYDTLYYPGMMKASKIAKIIGKLYPDFDMDRWHMLMNKYGLDEKKKPVSYSKGMQMKFMLTMVFARKAKVLILDEPTAGMDPAARRDLVDAVQEYMLDEDNTVIFSTHITSDLDKIADYIALVSDGELKLFEEKDKILEEYVLVQVACDAMTEELEKSLIGIKQNSFGYVGLVRDKDAVKASDKIKISRATVEDLIIYG